MCYAMRRCCTDGKTFLFFYKEVFSKLEYVNMYSLSQYDCQGFLHPNPFNTQLVELLKYFYCTTVSLPYSQFNFIP